MDSEGFITRARLHELVWQEPMSHLAERFGISDVRLRRICERYDISRPAVGYWSKLAYGKPVERLPLSEARPFTERLRISHPNRTAAWLMAALANALCIFLISAEG